MLAFGLVLFVSAATGCESLTTLSTPQVTVLGADVVPAGIFTPPPPPSGAPPAATGTSGRGGVPTPAPPPKPIPQHCRVRLSLKPSADSNIYSELWLPTGTWNGKLLVVGNGGFAGSIQGYGDMQIALRLGYATAATDTGRNVETSYYKGCSTGGRMGIMAATRFPEDYDGIIAGALANRHIHMHTAGFARQVVLARNPDMAISPETATFVSDAVIAKCDTRHEGFLNNPKQCTFEFATLACKGAETNQCLTPAQLK